MAFLHLSAWAAVAGTAGVFAAGMILENPFFLRATIGGVAFFILAATAAAVMGHRLNCFLCANPVFEVKPCRKHGRARRFLGVSYRLGVATESLFRRRFHCMYCGERIPLRKPPEKPPKITDPLSDPHGERLILTSGVELPPRRH